MHFDNFLNHMLKIHYTFPIKYWVLSCLFPPGVKLLRNALWPPNLVGRIPDPDQSVMHCWGQSSWRGQLLGRAGGLAQRLFPCLSPMRPGFDSQSGQSRMWIWFSIHTCPRRFPPSTSVSSCIWNRIFSPHFCQIHFWWRPLNLVHNALLGRAWLFAECYK